jgi:hypothetical protein
LEITEIKTKTETKTVETFVNNAGYVNKGTAREYRKRLKLFAKFVNESNSISLDELVETLTIMARHNSGFFFRASTKVSIPVKY